MKKIVVLLFCLAGYVHIQAQLLSTDVKFPADNNALEITMDASFGNGALVGHAAEDVYVHTGVITSLSTSPTNWKYVRPANFNQPEAALKAVSLGNNKWKFTLPGGIRSYYGVPGGETILRIAILFRSGNGQAVQRNRDGSDMYIEVYPSGQLRVKFDQPFFQPTYQSSPEPLIKQAGQSIAITAVTNQAATITIYYNGLQVATAPSATTLNYNALVSQAGKQLIVVEASNGGQPVRDTFYTYVAGTTISAALPDGMQDGINYNNDGTSATLVLFAPFKNHIVVSGEFNDWKPDYVHQMKRTPDNLRYWIAISGLTPGTEYAYQYLIDDTLQVADYNAEKILDPWNDPYIKNDLANPNRYPNLKAYPSGKTSGIVSLLQPGKAAYNWANNSFQRPDKRNLVVYELLVRDFGAKADFQMMIDTLPYLAAMGINAIELMPFTEFEGNNSWGYNPMFMFAVDKYYGHENKLREFIDSCHGRGIAVVLDMVLNHQFGQSPMVQMYWNKAQNKPAANSPWFNPDAKHPFNVGYDMNHEAPATIAFVERVMKHWLQKFKLDGFRWDLSKGFTQTNNPNDVNAWSAFDQSRINIWNRIYDQSQVISPNCYMILEHLGANSEEAELAKKGMLLWGNMNYNFNEASMGWIPNSNFDGAYHTTRWNSYGAGNTPHLLGYAESHDEERLAYKNKLYGNNTNGNHNTRSVSTYTSRLAMINAFLFTIPGPKQLWQFGELAYDLSINTCEDGVTISNDCRVAPKPVSWNMPDGNYNTIATRVNLKQQTAKIISLRTKYPQYLSTYTSNQVAYSLGGSIKWQSLIGPDMSITTAGNFDVTEKTATISFPSAGTWYIYTDNLDTTLPSFLGGKKYNEVNALLTPKQIVVPAGQTNQSFAIPPGIFFLFTSVDLNAVITEYVFTGNGNWSSAANWQNAAVPPAVLHNGKHIIINPAADGECVLDVSQTIATGATITIAAGKKFRIQGDLNKQ